MILNNDEIKKILTVINSTEEKNRRTNEIKNHEIYEEKLRDFVKSELERKYPKTFEDYTVADYNLVKKITDKKSKSYSKPPVRKLDKDAETEHYVKILNDFGFDEAMKLVDRYMNQHRYCALGVIRDRNILADDGSHTDSFNFWALAPYEFVVVRDNNGEIYAWAIPTGKTDKGEYWTLWTTESHMRVYTEDFSSFTIQTIEGNEQMVNPYGRIPFVYIPLDMSGTYPNTSSLVMQSIEVNTNLSVYLTSGNMQIGQLVYSHPATIEAAEIKLGLRTATNLLQPAEGEGEATLEYISPSPNLEGHKDSIMTYMMLILDQHGITSSKIGGGSEQNFTSGFDRLIANADVQDIIENNQTSYVKVENEVYKIIRAMNLKDGTLTLTSERLKVIFARPQIMLSDSEKLENLKKKKELGLWDEWELLMDANPNLTEEEAKKIIEERAVRTGSSKNLFNGAQVSSLVEVIKEVAAKTIPRESGVEIIMAAFGLTAELADKMIPKDSFVPAIEEKKTYGGF